MLEFKVYYYYSITDPTQEAIDKVIAVNYEHALEYFAERKKIDKHTFTTLYKIIEKWI